MYSNDEFLPETYLLRTTNNLALTENKITTVLEVNNKTSIRVPHIPVGGQIVNIVLTGHIMRSMTVELFRPDLEHKAHGYYTQSSCREI